MSRTVSVPGVPSAESVEVRELKQGNRVLEQENEILSRAAAVFATAQSQMMYPPVFDPAAALSKHDSTRPIDCLTPSLSLHGRLELLEHPPLSRTLRLAPVAPGAATTKS
jgi:hypothetical protein